MLKLQNKNIILVITVRIPLKRDNDTTSIGFRLFLVLIQLTNDLVVNLFYKYFMQMK